MPIDFVVTWVDGNDEAWQLEKNKHNPSNKKGNTSARYREWNQFKYLKQRHLIVELRRE